MKRLRVAAVYSLVIAAICALTAVQLIYDLWTYKEKKP
jgi:hypothetical protein